MLESSISEKPYYEVCNAFDNLRSGDIDRIEMQDLERRTPGNGHCVEIATEAYRHASLRIGVDMVGSCSSLFAQTSIFTIGNGTMPYGVYQVTYQLDLARNTVVQD